MKLLLLVEVHCSAARGIPCSCIFHFYIFFCAHLFLQTYLSHFEAHEKKNVEKLTAIEYFNEEAAMKQTHHCTARQENGVCKSKPNRLTW